MSVCVTEGVKVSVQAQYLVEQSEPQENKHIFAYQITITNEGEQPAQLLTRHWVIKDAHHHIEEVRGEGVVGETPYLEPGESFTYTSFCPLRTEFGTMRGSYGMTRPDGATFDAIVAPFALMTPALLN